MTIGPQGHRTSYLFQTLATLLCHSSFDQADQFVHTALHRHGRPPDGDSGALGDFHGHDRYDGLGIPRLAVVEILEGDLGNESGGVQGEIGGWFGVKPCLVGYCCFSLSYIIVPFYFYFRRPYSAAFNPFSISAMMSPTFSRPTEKRIMPPLIPAATSCSSVSWDGWRKRDEGRRCGYPPRGPRWRPAPDGP